jgi:tRNA A-37 threonylcarbamoyl transferase component Bud32
VPPRQKSEFTGKKLGRCTIGRPVGRGATATVFHARYEPLKRDVAVKILRADQATSDEARTRFVEEARSLAKLDHENVVKVYDVVEDDGYLLIIMDFVKGADLLQHIEEEGPPDAGTAIDWARQIAQALDHAHGQKILHRDVKPGNAILADDGRVVLVDFGNAEAVGKAADRKGTAHYVAPEVFQGKRQDEKCDTYSLGASLFHFLTGEPPYAGQTTQAILKAHAEGKLRRPSQVNTESGIPKAVDDLVKRSMAPTKGYRFLARDFVTALDELGQKFAAETRGGGRGRRRRVRSGGGGGGGSSSTIAMVIAIVVLVVVVAFLANLGGEEKEKTDDAVVVDDKPEPTKTDGPGTIDPGIDKRAENREARQAAARTAFDEAESFERRNMGDPKAVADRWATVATEFGELSVGRTAREREKQWREKSLSVDERAEREKEKERVAEERKTELETIDGHIAGGRFGEALLVMQKSMVLPLKSKAREWERREERLNLLLGLHEILAEALDGNEVELADVRTGLGKTGDKIVSATVNGLTIAGEMGQRSMAWSDFTPKDITKLSRRVLRNAPEPRLTLACYCWETGQTRQAVMQIDTAMLTDNTGTVSGRIEKLFGPEEEWR